MLFSSILDICFILHSFFLSYFFTFGLPLFSPCPLCTLDAQTRSPPDAKEVFRAGRLSVSFEACPPHGCHPFKEQAHGFPGCLAHVLSTHSGRACSRAPHCCFVCYCELHLTIHGTEPFLTLWVATTLNQTSIVSPGCSMAESCPCPGAHGVTSREVRGGTENSIQGKCRR